VALAAWLGSFGLSSGAGTLSLAWTSGAGYRAAPAFALTLPTRDGFSRVASQRTRVTFTNAINPIIAASNQILENGAGVALGDVDGDGWCDIFLCGSERPSALYRNLGQWQFEDITAAAGVACAGQFSTGAAWADVDGDGDLDLLVNGMGVGTRLFLNDGRGHFTEDNQSGLSRTYGATSMTLADIDGDGDLDLYVCNYRTSTVRDDPNPPRLTARLVQGRVVVSPEDRFTGFLRADGTVEVVEKGEPDILYLNNGRGKFSPVPWKSGDFRDEAGGALTAAPEDWSLSAMFRDLNGDGWVDLYVCNDFLHSPDRCWLGDGKGHFRAVSATTWRNMPASSMAMDAADINRDGFDDFLVVEMLSREHAVRQRQRGNTLKREWNLPIGEPDYRPEVLRNTLQLGRGDGTFAEVAYFAGLEATEWSWNVAFVDVDLDGWEDVLVTTGSNHDQLDADMLDERGRPGAEAAVRKGLIEFGRLERPCLAFRNRRDLTFEEVGAQWGFNAMGVAQGLALADLDLDGDLDVVVNPLNAEAALYRNESGAPRLAVRLKGRAPNTRAIGARAEVRGGPVDQSQNMVCGGRYLSADDAVRVFAAGQASELTVEVRWPNGSLSRTEHLLPNHICEIVEGEAPGISGPPPAVVSRRTRRAKSAPAFPIFENVSSLLQHRHVDEAFDDFARQPLLPRRLGQLGPGVSWFDLDGDGWDDLFVGSGKGGKLAAFRNDGHGAWQRLTGTAWEESQRRDQAGVLGFAFETPRRGLLVAAANYEDGPGTPAQVRRYELEQNTATVRDWLTFAQGSPGPMAMADVDGDGDLDLFAGSRVMPGRYPEAGPSMLFRNENGEFKPDARRNAVLAGAGMVSGAVFTDLEGDGTPELVLACEWGPVRVFRMETNRCREVTGEMGLASLTGFWNGVATGDFDEDGRQDLIVSNWGRNTRFRATPERPWLLYVGDFNGDGSLDLVEATMDAQLRKTVPWRARDALATAMPALRSRFGSYREFAAAGIEEVLGAGVTNARRLEVTTLDSLLLLNRGARFEARPLPREAQFAPAFGVAVADFDGDGHEDVVLAQNFFGTELETSRADAGRGLLLFGDGRGEFQCAPSRDAGIEIYGEQRGAAVSDYDADGRADLVLGQNAGATQLFHNRAARPGVRVRLRGAPANPTGIGAVVRLGTRERLGPAREIHAGSGYWSQDSSVPVLCAGESPAAQLWIRWPQGRTNVFELRDGVREVAVTVDGQVEVRR